MSAARPDTWMPIYIGDYLADTMHLSCLEHGAYLLLIFAYWRSGKPLPDNDRVLAGICKMTSGQWRAMRPTMSGFFQITDGVWRHKRIDAEISKTLEISEKRSAAGSHGAAKRWKSNETGMASAIPEPLANAQQNDALYSHSHNSSLRSEVDPPNAPLGRSKRGTRLPADWRPCEQSCQLSDALGFSRAELDGTIEPEFRDFWVAVPGAKGCKLDWDATFNNRLRELARRRDERAARSGGVANRQGPVSSLAAARRAAARFQA